MQDLLKKIEDSARVRLATCHGKQPAKDLARYKTFLKVETHRLKILHRAGAGGLHICQARAAVLDTLLRHLWDRAKSALSEQARKEFPPIALVAIGGYGRGELNPHSDIDFMFLHEGQVAAGKPLAHLGQMIDGLLYTLWDIGLKVGHSVRSIEDCVRVANDDMQAKTSLIEARLITGDQALFEKFSLQLVRKCVSGHEQEYIGMRVEDQAARRAKFGNSAFMQEPNIKNGCGGLRDFQNLIWMAYFKYRTKSLRDLLAHRLIGESERKQLESAYDFLLRVRTEMHYHLNRGLDALTKSIQPAVALNLGWRERSPSKRIEGFMRTLYRHLRNIYVITRTLEQRLALFPQPRRLSLRSFFPGRAKVVAEPVDGFQFVDGQIVAESDRVFREQPRRLMRVFLYAQQRNVRLHPDLAQMIRQRVSLVDRSFIADEHVRDTFLAILSQRGSVAPILRAMHETDLLGKYVPEFGKLTCLVQHEFYHQYTADEHTLMCIEQLDRIWQAKEPPRLAYLELFHNLERPNLLYLALLLHDVGKPEGHGRHTDVSADMALRVARRLRLDASATQVLRLVIAHHLLLASISQRRDLDDPSVVQYVARQVQNVETLQMLTVHTFVDAQATSDKLWNGFKDSLLWTLYKKTLRLMTGGPEQSRADEQQREMLKQEVRRLAKEETGQIQLSQDEIEAHFATLPPRYYQIHLPKQVYEDIQLAHQFMTLQICEEKDTALEPVIRWQDDLDRGCNAVRICTWDRAGLFSKVAGCFSAAGLNILTAQVFTRKDGIVLDKFFVTDARTGNLAGKEQRDKFQELLVRGLTGDQVDFFGAIARQKVQRPMYQGYGGEEIPSHIRFDNDSSDTRTIVEIETEDRVGLLYRISQALSELSLDISGAKILTEKGAAIDSFYLRELDGKKVVGAERQRSIERKLKAVVAAVS